MTIRRAEEADVPALCAMTQEFLDSTAYGRLLETTPERIDAFVATVLQVGVVFVAEGERGAVVAMLALIVGAHPLTGEVYGDEVAWWVDPKYRHGTIGPRLLRHVEDWASTAGLGMLKMVAPAGTSTGRHLETLGYQPVETAYRKELRPGRIHDPRADGSRRLPRRQGREEGADGHGPRADGEPDGDHARDADAARCDPGRVAGAVDGADRRGDAADESARGDDPDAGE